MFDCIGWFKTANQVNYNRTRTIEPTLDGFFPAVKVDENVLRPSDADILRSYFNDPAVLF